MKLLWKRGSLEYHCLLTSAKALGKGLYTFQYNLCCQYNAFNLIGCFRTGNELRIWWWLWGAKVDRVVIEGVRFWRAEARTLTVSCSAQVLFYFAKECNAMQLGPSPALHKSSPSAMHCSLTRTSALWPSPTLHRSSSTLLKSALHCSHGLSGLCTWSGPSAKKVFAGARFETDNKAGITSRKWRKSASLGSFAIVDISEITPTSCWGDEMLWKLFQIGLWGDEKLRQVRINTWCSAVSPV